MGLLDQFFGQGFDDPRSQANMALASGLLGGNFSQGVQGYGQAMSGAKDAEMKRKMQQMQMEQMQSEIDQRNQAAQQKRAMEAMAAKFATPAGTALPAIKGDTESGILPSAGRAATPAGYDYKGYAEALAGVNPQAALALQQSMQKESTINKLDVKDFTPESVAKYAQTRNYGDLIRMDKAHFANTGGQTTAMNPFTGQPLNSIANTQSPDSLASNQTTMRGQDMTDARARERFAFDQAGGADAGKPKLVGENWVTAPAGMRPGQVIPAMPSTASKDANEALKLIQTAKRIIPESTGSYLGAGIDQVGRVFGGSTSGDTAAAQLKALEGALVSKMPKMSGPQSDKDVLLYKQMAGEIGDSTIPNSRKMAALQVIEEIQQRHAGAVKPSATPAATMRWNPKTSTIEMVN